MLTPQLTTWAMTLSPDDPGSWQHTFDTVVAADRAGMDRVALSGEHVCFGEHLEAYGKPELGGREGARQITGPDGHYIEPFVTMSMIAAQTKNVRFLPNILLAALRPPVVLAKMCATLDLLSGGRLDLGIGVGWQKEEYDACGVDFGSRGRILDEALEICHLLWTERVASYSSENLSFENIHMMPKPAAPGGRIPVWVSGNVKPAVMRRLARFGSGWIPWGEASDGGEALVAEIPRMREAVAELGADPMKIAVSGNLPIVWSQDGAPLIGPTMEKVPALVEAGVTDFRCLFQVPRDIAAAEDFLAGWVQAFRAATGRPGL